jgi:hypothetical protein
MSKPPDLLPFGGDWMEYEDKIYAAFLDSFVNPDIRFNGWRVSAQYRPETNGKGFSFWHAISEAPNNSNRNEEDRVPNIRRCERIRWICWAIENAGNDGFLWWENQRRNNTHVVIWAREHDFAVVLAKRRDYYVLKTAYAEIKPHRRKSFESEHAAFWKSQKG